MGATYLLAELEKGEVVLVLVFEGERVNTCQRRQLLVLFAKISHRLLLRIILLNNCLVALETAHNAMEFFHGIGVALIWVVYLQKRPQFFCKGVIHIGSSYQSGSYTFT